jgi:hypothetical protein
LHLPAAGGPVVGRRTRTMGERQIPLSNDHEATIAAFDREREEVHELNRRHREIIARSRRNDRLITQEDEDRDR